MKKFSIAIAFISFLILSACVAPYHNRIVDVKLENLNQLESNQALINKKVVVVFYPDFSNYVYEHYDNNFRITFMIPIGAYTSTKLNQELSFILNVKTSNRLKDVNLETFDYILIPEFGQITYTSPMLAVSQDAHFALELKVRILDGSKQEIETMYSQGNSVGVFGQGGKNTNILVQDAVNKNVTQFITKLKRIILNN